MTQYGDQADISQIMSGQSFLHRDQNAVGCENVRPCKNSCVQCKFQAKWGCGAMRSMPKLAGFVAASLQSNQRFAWSTASEKTNISYKPDITKLYIYILEYNKHMGDWIFTRNLEPRLNSMHSLDGDVPPEQRELQRCSAESLLGRASQGSANWPRDSKDLEDSTGIGEDLWWCAIQMSWDIKGCHDMRWNLRWFKDPWDPMEKKYRKTWSRICRSLVNE